jgi:dTDP-4-dehydrorhamnose 3,5-epimerase-like enzyme
MPEQILSPPRVSRCQRIQLGRVDERRGSLCVAEVGRQIPFEVQRAYWIFGVGAESERANHAHREQSELVVAVGGSFTVHCDDGEVRSAYTLDSPDEALLLPPMVFHHLDDFAPGSTCLVLASGPYDPDEYVSDHAEFRKLMARR